jgi:thiamine-monophosphate kinase
VKGETVREIDERAFIRRLAALFGSGGTGIIAGAGEDDCAVIDMGDECLVATTDMLHRKTDFPEGMSAWQIGWMSAAVNFSDIAAMGAQPLGLLAAVGYPPDMSLKDAEEIARGMRDCASFCGTSVIGGDVDSHDELTITGTALGKARKADILTRRGAGPGDKICVTGFTGSAGAALHALENGIRVPQTLLNKLFEPVPRVREAQQLARSGAVTCMTDTSDGLAMSLYDLADINGVGFRIDAASLPLQAEISEYIPADPEAVMEFALYTGGDFELLFTVSPDRLGRAQSVCYLSVIGEIVQKESGNGVICHGGENLSIYRKGYLQLGT